MISCVVSFFCLFGLLVQLFVFGVCLFHWLGPLAKTVTTWSLLCQGVLGSMAESLPHIITSLGIGRIKAPNRQREITKPHKEHEQLAQYAGTNRTHVRNIPSNEWEQIAYCAETTRTMCRNTSPNGQEQDA